MLGLQGLVTRVRRELGELAHASMPPCPDSPSREGWLWTPTGDLGENVDRLRSRGAALPRRRERVGGFARLPGLEAACVGSQLTLCGLPRAPLPARLLGVTVPFKLETRRRLPRMAVPALPGGWEQGAPPGGATPGRQILGAAPRGWGGLWFLCEQRLERTQASTTFLGARPRFPEHFLPPSTCSLRACPRPPGAPGLPISGTFPAPSAGWDWMRCPAGEGHGLSQVGVKPLSLIRGLMALFPAESRRHQHRGLVNFEDSATTPVRSGPRGASQGVLLGS